VRDLLHLWRTRHIHGFPWPFQWFGGDITPWLTGYWRFSPVPVWRQVLRIPGRPFRYWRMLRSIARVRSMPYSHADQDTIA
jgi:hypothetical protein